MHFWPKTGIKMAKIHPAQNLKCKIYTKKILFYNNFRISGCFVASFGQKNVKNCNFKQKMPKFWPKFVHQSIFVINNVEILSNNIIL